MPSNKVITPKVPFIDAQERSRKSSSMLITPTDNALSKITSGSIVKLSTGGELFWVLILAKDRNVFLGKVDNHLISTDIHGLNGGDLIEFEQRHIFVIFVEPEKAQ